MKLDPLNDGISSIELIDSMGNDLSIINCARVSYNNYQTELTEKDTKLLKYLWEHKHYSPFRSVVFTFKIKAPLYVCRQWYKHTVASSNVDDQLQWNEQCLSGNQAIRTWWGRDFTVKKIFDLFQKGKAPYIASMLPDGTIGKGKIKSVWSTGVNKVYRVVSELGFTIVSTSNHRYLTPSGYKQLKDLVEGDLVMMNGQPVYRDASWLKENYIDKDCTLDELSQSIGCSSHVIRKWLKIHNLHLSRKEVSDRSIRRHGVFGKGETKETNQKLKERGQKVTAKLKGVPKSIRGEDHWEFKGDDATDNAGRFRARKLVDKIKCKFCNSTDRLEVHHVDENPLNNTLENLEVVCRKHHNMRHGKYCVMKAHAVKIKSIEYLGEEETFDFEIEDYHNLVVNHFIVHNSMRYTEAKDPNEFYIPKQFRTQSKLNKQCSVIPLVEEENKVAIELYAKQCKDSYEVYQKLIELGVGREQARGVLVPAIYTSWIWTTSLQALLNFLFLRSTMESQYEIRCYANSIPTLVKDIIPETLKLLN